MIFAKFITLFFVAALPFFVGSFVVPKTGSKVCEIGKVGADSVKDLAKHLSDFTIAITAASKLLPDGKTVRAVAGAVTTALLHEDVIKILSYIGPIGGMIGACLGVGKVVLDKKDEELKNAMFDLSKQLDSIVVHIDKSVIKILSHQDELQFQQLVTSPAKVLQGAFRDYLHSLHHEDLKTMKRLCKKNMPIQIFENMNTLLEKNSDNILASHYYTDLAFANLRIIYMTLFLELTPLHFVCEDLMHKPKDPPEDEQEKLRRRTKTIERKYIQISERFGAINARRAQDAWRVMPNRLNEWYGEYKKLKDGREFQHNFTRAVAEQLNEDYYNLGYDYAFGVAKNRPKYIHFACHETACHYKREKDFVVWVLRTKPCRNDTKTNMVTRASTCLQFEMLLYARFNAEFEYNNITAVTEMLQRNCRIRNIIGFASVRVKLNSSSAGEARKANIFPNSRNRVPYNILTERNHAVIRKSSFDDWQFWADCKNENREPFNFIDEYCTPESAWPTCRLKERAFQYHQLKNAEQLAMSMAPIPYVDTWAPEKERSMVATFNEDNKTIKKIFD
uniref:Uncharacterized protein n=1 Tax=Panagrolaimus superbus TaxID=310955 RepID=A0A914YTW6_9BILA